MISGITYSTKINVNTIRKLNDQLKIYCESHGFIYISNDSISIFSINDDVQKNTNINLHMDSSDSDIDGLIDMSKSDPNNPIDINSDVDSHIVKLKNIRLKNPTRLIFAHININSIRNKFDMLSDLIVGKVDQA